MCHIECGLRFEGFGIIDHGFEPTDALSDDALEVGNGWRVCIAYGVEAVESTAKVLEFIAWRHGPARWRL